MNFKAVSPFEILSYSLTHQRFSFMEMGSRFELYPNLKPSIPECRSLSPLDSFRLLTSKSLSLLYLIAIILLRFLFPFAECFNYVFFLLKSKFTDTFS